MLNRALRRSWTAVLIASACAGTVLTAAGASTQVASSAPPTDGTISEDLAALNALWPATRYRVAAGDVLQLSFPYVPEFDQTLTVQPDGYVALRALDDIRVAGKSVAEVRHEVTTAYHAILRDPLVTVTLREFEAPSFIAGGEIAKPGRYPIRGPVTLTQALAIAGGPTSAAKRSEVLLLRRFGDAVEVKPIDVQLMFESRDLSEDPLLRSGDTIYVPKSRLSSLIPWIPKPGISVFPPFM